MKPTSIIALSLTTLAALAVMTGSALWLGAGEPRKPYPKPTPPPPPSPVYTPSRERAQTAQEIEADAHRHNELLALEIERALVARDPQQRETAFTFLLPELLQDAPERAVVMVEHQEPGEARDTLRDEVARQWITRDRDAAIKWMHSFEAETERHASARVAVDTLAAVAPEQAIYVADQFGIGRDDGYLERLVQIWATANLGEATRWIEAQPDGPRTEQLRRRIELVRAQR